jgi:hypothetical protein
MHGIGGTMTCARVSRLLSAAVAAAVILGASRTLPSAQAPAPADLRKALEGTWQLEEWHVGGQVLRPPQADGRWSNHDGIVLFVLHRADTAESTMGYGVYEMTADTWGYRYLRMQNTSGPTEGPFKVAVQPPGQMRSFKVKREPGKVVLEGVGEDRREYEGPFFTFFQKGQIIRKWRRVP